jgi:flagellar M-ring protein FliF
MANIEIVDQAKTFFGKLTAMQRYVIFGTIGLVAVGMIFLFASVGSKKDMAVLYSSLEERDASKIVEKLKERKIDYELKDGGSTILVPRDKQYDTRLDMASAGLPEVSVVGYEIFDKTNLGMSEFVQKVNYRRALEGELTKTIGANEEIKKVRVHLVMPDKALFDKDQKKPTASVQLQLTSGRSLSKISVVGIQNLIAGSVEGLSPDAVMVVDNRGKILSEISADKSTVAGLTASQHEQKIKAEHYLTDKAQTQLDAALGRGNTEVRVNTELDFTQIEKTITDFDPEKTAVRSEQNISEKSQSTDSLSYPAVSQARDQANTISNYEVPKTVEKIIQGVGNIKRLTVSVLVNGTVKVIDQKDKKIVQNVPRTNEELDKLTQIVKNAIGYDPGRNDQISVINVAFDTQDTNELLEEMNKPIWWKEPDTLKLFGLLAAMLVTILLMYKLLRSKFVKERIRIAMNLPEHVKIDEKEEEEEEEEEILEELQIDDDDLLLLPAELPDQLLLEGEREGGMDFYDGEESEDEEYDKDMLASRARARLNEPESNELTENDLMKMELKSKVETYVGDQPMEAVRLIRFLLSQDADDAPFKF